MAEENVASKVLDHQRHTEALRVLRVARPPGLDFVAGQFTKIGFALPEQPRPLMRAYSFVNAPQEEALEFCYDVLPEGGNLTVLLDKLQAGDELLVSTRPNGLLVLDNLPAGETLFLVATGTGIGPFVSILGQGEGAAFARFARIVLVYSGRYFADLVYHQRLAELAAGREQLSYLPLVTREQAQGCPRMRVTEALAAGELARLAAGPIDASCQFMLCGNPAMVQDMCELLGKMGLERNRRSKPGNVTIEKYW